MQLSLETATKAFKESFVKLLNKKTIDYVTYKRFVHPTLTQLKKCGIETLEVPAREAFMRIDGAKAETRPAVIAASIKPFIPYVKLFDFLTKYGGPDTVSASTVVMGFSGALHCEATLCSLLHHEKKASGCFQDETQEMQFCAQVGCFGLLLWLFELIF